MRAGFRSGLAAGVVIGVTIGYFGSHIWGLGWLFLGIAIGALLVASGIWRPRFFRSRAAGR
jgi:predicted MFS family arabinose efflux permease